MILTEKIKSWFKTNGVIKDLWHFDQEPLNVFSILLLIALDIFLLVAISSGIQDEKSKSPSPTQYFPQECTIHFDEKHKIPANTKYNDFGNNDFNYNYYKVSSYLDDNHYKSDICQKLDEKIRYITSDANFEKNKKTFFSLNSQKDSISSRVDQLRNMYDIRLTEQIANQTNNVELEKAKNEFDGLIKELNDVETKLNAIPAPSTYRGFMDLRKFVDKNRAIFQEQKQSYEKWYPFYQYFRMLSFVIPLMLITLFIYKKLTYPKIRPIVSIISSNLIVILSIPLLFGTIELIYDLIPKILLQKIINFFISIGLLSILKYIIIAIITTIIGVIIYWVQKKAAEKKRLMEISQIKKTISSGLCGVCKNKVDLSYKFCPSCGNNLKVVCPHCKKETTKDLPCCFNCGGDLETKQSEDV
ncbi:MAG: zinc ribbon domain-containing protein [Sulfurovaceae bacterium]|nr:zinc ribbon domain-containing protein [Sulfurovaceae bacterium]MDD5548764.1 zinc ribbon domain-containing protein [Sulfurovaceae bacterium]